LGLWQFEVEGGSMSADEKNPEPSVSSPGVVIADVDLAMEIEGAKDQPLVRLAEDTTSQPLPPPGGSGSSPAPFDPRQTPLWQALLAEYEREIAAIGEVPAAAPLYYESGKIWEEKLAQPRNAWESYNKAFRLQPRLLPNIRAAQRLASQVGNWNAALNIIDSEIEAVEDPVQKAYLFQRRGLIMEEKLGRAEDARASYQSAVDLDPNNVEFLRQLERLFISQADWKNVADVREKLLGQIQDPRVLVQLLLGCARLQEVVFQKQDKAQQLFRRVLQIEPTNSNALNALVRIYTNTRQFEPLVEILPKLAQEVTDPTQSSMLYYQLARILREQMGDDERAIEALQQALGFSPSDHMILGELANIYENLMRWQELVSVFERQVTVISDRQELVSLYFHLGNIWEEKLFNEDKAIPNYRKVLELNPSYLPALQALGKLFYRKGEWESLVKMYELEIRESQDTKSRAVKYYKLAEILEERLSRDEEAIQKLEQCLELSPGYLPALKTLGVLYAKYNRWESLIGMYEKELAVTQDRDQAVFLLDKIGNLWVEKLNNTDKAIETYQRILEESPNHLPTIRSLGKLYVRADRWEDTIRVNELESQLVNDQKQVISLLHRNGEIFEEKLNDKDQAIETYKKVLALAPNYLPALQSLGRLYFIKGRWEDLIAMYRQEIEVTQNEQQITLLYKIGELYEEKLVQEDKAIGAYQEVLRIQESNFPALKALICIFKNKRDWENLLQTQLKEANALEDPRQKAFSLFQVAEIWENHLNRPEKAIDVLQQILQVVPDQAPAIRALCRLYTQGGNWRELLLLHERELQNATLEAQKAEILSRMAEIYHTQLNDLVRAADCYEKVLTSKPDHLSAIEALERIYLTQRNYVSLLRNYESLASRTNDSKLLVSLQSQIADIKENRLQPPQNAGENHLKVVALDPAHPDALRNLDVLYHRFGTWTGLRLLYERELTRPHTLEEQLDLCMRVADLAESRLGVPPLAIHYYREALRLIPDHLPAIKAIKRLYQTQDNIQEMIGLLGREGQVSRDPRQAITTLLQAGKLYQERFNDPAHAIDCFFKVLEKEPRETQAFNQLEELLIAQSNWEKLVVLYGNRIGVTDDPRNIIELHLKLGTLYVDKLQRPMDAVQAFQQVLHINPNHIQALASLANLSFMMEDWDGSLQFIGRLLELGCDIRLQAWAHFHLGVIFQEKKPELERAITHFRKVLEITPNDLSTLTRLKSIYIAQQRWAEASEILPRLSEVVTDPTQRIANLMELANLFERGVGDPDRTIEVLQRVQALDPNNVNVIQRLGDLYERLERWDKLVETYHTFVRLLPPERAQDAIPLYLKMGYLCSQKLGQPDQAIVEYQKVVEINPRHNDAHLALAGLYGQNGMTYANAVEEHRKLLEINPFRIESYHELRRIFEEQRAFDKVFCVCSVLHFLRAADSNEESFFADNRGKIPDQSEKMLSEEEKVRFLTHPGELGLVRDIVKIIGLGLSKVYSPNLERHGVGKGNRAKQDDPMRGMLDGMMQNIGATELDLYYSSQPNFVVSIENTDPPALIVGDGLLKRTNPQEQRFALGRALQRVASGSFLATSIGVRSLAQLIAAAVHPTFPNCPVVTYPSESIEELSRVVSKSISRKQRKVLEDYLHEHSPELAKIPDFEAYLRNADHTANRVGMIEGNDLPKAIMHLMREVTELRDLRLGTTEDIASNFSRHTALCELIRFCVSEEYFRLRAEMKLTVAG
jgi:cellulose synthase operon protein C